MAKGLGAEKSTVSSKEVLRAYTARARNHRAQDKQQRHNKNNKVAPDPAAAEATAVVPPARPPAVVAEP